MIFPSPKLYPSFFYEEHQKSYVNQDHYRTKGLVDNTVIHNIYSSQATAFNIHNRSNKHACIAHETSH
jgi:hypothetical protein